MATLTEILARHQLAVFYYVIPHGTGKCFSNIPVSSKWETSPGSGQVSIDGEVYDWEQSLYLTDSDQLPAFARMVMKAGFVEPTNLDLHFAVSGHNRNTALDAWLNLITPPGQRADINRSKLQRTLSVTSTSATATPTTNWPTSGVVHIGTEACTYSGKTSESFTGLTRGAFKSHAQPHETLIGERFVAGSGPILADIPLAWEGRTLEVWMGFAKRSGETWTPFAAAPATLDADFQIGKYSLIDVDMVDKTQLVRLSTVDISQRRADKILTRHPKGIAYVRGLFGHNRGDEIIIDGYSNKLNWNWVPTSGAATVFPNPQTDIRLIRDNGMGGQEDVPDGKYTRAEVEAYVGFTITNTISSGPWGVDDELSCRITIDSEFKATLRFTSNADTADQEDYSFVIMPDSGSPHNLWRELGFEAEQWMTPNVATSGDVVWTSPASEKAVPLFRWPKHDPAITTYRRLYFTGDGPGLNFQPDPGFVDDDGNTIDGHLLIGDYELVSFDARTTDGTALYLNITGRNLAGSGDEEIYVETVAKLEDAEDLPELRQVIAFPNTSPYIAELQLLHSGSGVPGTNGPWDKGWIRCGLALPEDFSNAQTYIDMAAQKGAPSRRPMLVFTESEELREAMRAEYIATQTVPVGLVSTAGFKIGVVEAAHPRIGDTTAQVLDASVIKSTGRADFEIENSHRKIINEAKVNTNWNPASDKFRTKINAWDQQSRATYREKKGLEFNLKGYHTGFESEAAVANVTQDIWAQYGGPYQIIRVDVAWCPVWLWQLGSIVSLTHPSVPNLVNVGRGVTSVNCRIVAYQHFYRPQEGLEGITARLWLIPSAGRFPRYAPTAKIASRTSDTVFTIVAQQYTHADSGRDDTSGFPEGSWVKIFRAGNEAAESETAQIASWSTYTVTLESPGVSLNPSGGELRMEYVDFDDANATEFQQAHAAMSVNGEITSGVPAMEWS